VNASGYGLTFGLHTRIDDRVQHVSERIEAGNVYINRNQIGAIVGSQPFGGEGLSGTGPKAGGPQYLARFTKPDAPRGTAQLPPLSAGAVAKALPSAPETVLAEHSLPGPTGESNRLRDITRAPLLCLGPGPDIAAEQARAVQALGGRAVILDGIPQELDRADGFSAVLYWGDDANARQIAQALARRDGAILPLVTDRPDRAHVALERHLCVDTTASGGNAQLLAEVAS
jgi:RHH-type proline utilization regulon transcriptional repressor/proline dehydrogenase/delta 1-pyrroline-5-carboxylate dehydrogenase